MTSPVPAEVRRLIRVHLDTMSHVDALAALVRAPQGLTADQLARDAYMSASVATACLADLVDSGLAVAEGGAEGGAEALYRYAPATQEDQRAVEALLLWRTTRPVSLVRFMYERPTESLE